MALPTTDELFGSPPAERLPTTDELFGSPSTPERLPTTDELFARPSGDNRPIGTPRPLRPQAEVDLTPLDLAGTIQEGVNRLATAEQVKPAIDTVRRALVMGAGAVGGTALGTMAGAPFAGAMAGSVGSEALNNYLDDRPVTDNFSLPNLARTAVYSSLGSAIPGVGKAVPMIAQEALKLGTTLPAIDAFQNWMEGRPLTEGITPGSVAAEVAPAGIHAVAPAISAGQRLLGAYRAAKSSPGGIIEKLRSIGSPQGGDMVHGMPLDDFIEKLTPRNQGLRRSMPDIPASDLPAIRESWDNAAAEAKAAVSTDPYARLKKQVRNVVTAPANDLKFGSDPAGQVLGERIKRGNMITRRLAENFSSAWESTIGRLSEPEQILVRSAVEDPAVYASAEPHIQKAADRVTRIFDKAAAVLEDAGVMVRHGSNDVAFERLKNYFPRRYQIPDAANLDDVLNFMEKDGLTQEQAIRKALNKGRPTSDPFVQHGRKPIPEEELLPRLSPLEEGRQYFNEMSKQSGLAYAGGGELEAGVGKDFLRLATAMSSPEDTRRATKFLEDTYKRRRGPIVPPDALRSGVSRIAMPFAWLKQFGQIGTDLAEFGLPALRRGRAAIAADPTLAEMRALSGAGEAGLSGATNSWLGLDRDSVPSTWLRNVEYGMRSGVGAPSGYGELTDLVDAVKAGTRNAAIDRRAFELGTTWDDIANHLSMGGGNLDSDVSRALIMDSMQRASDNAFLQTQGGELPRLFENPWAALMLQYRPFGVGQTLAAKNLIAQPIRQGWQTYLSTGDRSLLDLGLKRAGRLGLYGGIGNAATSGVYSLATGRGLPESNYVTRDTIGGTLGTAGDAANTLVNLIAHPTQRGFFETMLSMPAVSTADRLTSPLLRGANNLLTGDFDAVPPSLLETYLNLKAARDDTGMWPMIARPATAYLEHWRKAAEDRK